MVSASQVASRFRAEFIARIITAVLGALLVIFLARMLDPDGYGMLFLALSFFGVAKLFSKLGVGGSVSRYIAEFKEDKPTQVPHIIRVGLAIVLLLTIIVTSVILVGHQYFADIIGEPELAPFLVIGTVYLVFSTLLHFVRKTLQGYEDIEFAAVTSIIQSTSEFVLTLGLVVIGLGAIGALVGYALSALVGSIVGLVYIYIQFYRPAERAPTIQSGLKRRIAEYAVPLTATDAAAVLDRRIDTLLVGFFLNPVAVSYYVVSKQVVSFIETPVSALGFSIAPTFATKKTAGNADHAARLYEEALRNTLLLYIPSATGIMLVAEPLVELVFGVDYLGAVPVLQVLSIYAVLLASNLIAAKALNFLGRARDRAIAKGVTSVMNVGLNIVLIPWIGVIGAAIATIITYSMYAFANIYLIHQELEIRVWYIIKISGQIVGVTVVMGGVVFYLLDYVHGWVTLFAVVVVGVSIWAVLSSVIGLLDIRELISKALL